MPLVEPVTIARLPGESEIHAQLPSTCTTVGVTSVALQKAHRPKPRPRAAAGRSSMKPSRSASSVSGPGHGSMAGARAALPRAPRSGGARASSRWSCSTTPPTRRSSSCWPPTRRWHRRQAGGRIRGDRRARRSSAGSGLTRAHDAAFKEVEAEFDVPRDHEVISVTSKLIAPTIDEFGTPDAARAVVPDVLPARRVLLPAVLRARRRERPRRPGVQGRARRRRVGARRPEGVDLDGAASPSTASPSAAPIPTSPSTPGSTAFLVPARRRRVSRSGRSGRCRAGRRSTRCS